MGYYLEKRRPFSFRAQEAKLIAQSLENGVRIL